MFFAQRAEHENRIARLFVCVSLSVLLTTPVLQENKFPCVLRRTRQVGQLDSDKQAVYQCRLLLVVVFRRRLLLFLPLVRCGT